MRRWRSRRRRRKPVCPWCPEGLPRLRSGRTPAAGGVEGRALPTELRQEPEAAEGAPLPLTNRRDDRLTTVVMTGVTALTRATAWEMDRNGVTLPARDIRDWVRQ